MFRKTCILLGLFAAVSAARLPVGVVQFGAWVDMFSDLVERTGSIRDSFSNTFNGDYRCAGCDFVSASTAQTEEQEQSATFETSFAKITLVLLSADVSVVAPSPILGSLVDDLWIPRFSVGETAVPPPRFA
ncbi:MAG: hypothetical protein CMI26_12025 [Opitutae bacterium]|jgi:hypothetical protein|nr:hypothetical protein [Opitutae bacterium]|tara:strand:+ start:12877 stop:13269 length:393 start_codon:yes stop_codon:yes gene_type:complete